MAGKREGQFKEVDDVGRSLAADRGPKPRGSPSLVRETGAIASHAELRWNLGRRCGFR